MICVHGTKHSLCCGFTDNALFIHFFIFHHKKHNTDVIFKVVTRG